MVPAGTTPSYLSGILAMLLGQLCFSINDALMKYRLAILAGTEEGKHFAGHRVTPHCTS